MTEDIPPPEITEGESTPNKTYKLGSWLMHYHKFYTESERGALWRYDPDEGIWKAGAGELIEKGLADYLAHQYRAHLVNEIRRYIRGKSYDENVNLGGPPHKIVMKNGVYDLDTGQFSDEFCPEEYHITKIPVKYDPSARCPKFIKFLNEILPGDDRREHRQAIIEFIGYCLYKKYPIASFLVLLGSGSNGKSVLLEVIRSFLGKENVSGCSLQELSPMQRFSKAELHGRLANIGAEIPPKTIKYSSTIKRLTGGDLIKAERKNQDPFHFRNHAKLLFTANKLPKSWDETNAFYRRFYIIRFFEQFKKNDPRTIPQHLLIKELTADEELAGLFNLAVEGWRKFNQRGYLCGEKSIEEKRLEYLELSGDIVKLMKLRYIQRDNLGVPIDKDSVYGWYSDLCHALGQEPLYKDTFFKKLYNVCNFIESKLGTNSNTSEREHLLYGACIDFDAIEKDIEHIGATEQLNNLNNHLLPPENYSKVVGVGKKGVQVVRCDDGCSEKENYDDVFENGDGGE